jgi:hypothetical protein
MDATFSIEEASSPCQNRFRYFCIFHDLVIPQLNGFIKHLLATYNTPVVCWCNPPYGRGQNVYSWVKKAYETSLEGGTVVCLLPASVDTKWFHEFVMKSSEIRFVIDRLWFTLNGKAARANHGSIVVVFKPANYLAPVLSAISNYREK